VASDLPGTNYDWALKYLTLPITSVVEVGSRDGLDAIALGRALGCRVDAFEAAPEQFLVVKENIRASGLKDVTAHEFALLDVGGTIDFFTVDPDLYDSTGLGSLYKVNFDNRQGNDVDAGRASIQRKTTVAAARFDTLDLPAPDLLVMDVQGSETKVLRGFGPMLTECRYVICEAEREPSYQGGNPFSEIDKFLKSQGFRIRASTVGSGSNFERRIHFLRTNAQIAWREKKIFPTRIYQGMFDVLYVNTRMSD